MELVRSFVESPIVLGPSLFANECRYSFTRWCIPAQQLHIRLPRKLLTQSFCFYHMQYYFGNLLL